MKYDLLWKGSRDGFGASTFHSKCNSKGATLTVIMSNNDKLFGGYTSESWGFSGSSGAYKYDPTAFLYSLTHKAKCKQKTTGNSICDDSGYGPRFGGGHDIDIYDNCNTNNSSSSNGNHTYELPSPLPQGTADNTFFAGSYNFSVKEIEVYHVSK